MENSICVCLYTHIQMASASRSVDLSSLSDILKVKWVCGRWRLFFCCPKKWSDGKNYNEGMFMVLTSLAQIYISTQAPAHTYSSHTVSSESAVSSNGNLCKECKPQGWHPDAYRYFCCFSGSKSVYVFIWDHIINSYSLRYNFGHVLGWGLTGVIAL